MLPYRNPPCNFPATTLSSLAQSLVAQCVKSHHLHKYPTNMHANISHGHRFHVKLIAPLCIQLSPRFVAPHPTPLPALHHTGEARAEHRVRRTPSTPAASPGAPARSSAPAAGRPAQHRSVHLEPPGAVGRGGGGGGQPTAQSAASPISAQTW